MPSNPTRKTEVQAYRFEIRRMNSALVRRDAVMLHDPLRTHGRATMVGVIIGVIGLLGFLLFGILKPKPKPPEAGIVIGEESAQIFVKVADPEMLIPVPNLASARLVLMSNQPQGEGGPQNPNDIEVVEPTVVPDDRLDGMRRGRLQGIPGATMLLPGEEQRISDDWAVCHHLPLNESLEDPEKFRQAVQSQRTAVLAGVADLGTPLDEGVAVLVELADRAKTMQLIYRPREDINRKAEMVRATIPDKQSVKRALGLEGEKPRPMTLGLLNSLEQVDDLNPPVVPGAGAATQFGLGSGRTANVGDVFRVPLPAGDKYYVVLQDGIQEITQAVATMMLYEKSPDAQELPQVTPEVERQIPKTGNPLKVEDYPEQIPTILDPLQHPTTCLGWTIDEDGDERSTVYRGKGVPYPQDATPIAVGQANESGIVVDEFYMRPGHGAVVKSATSEASFESGVIQLISDVGMRYGIPDEVTAAHLGLKGARPAPEKIIKLLPTAVSLNAQDAARTRDTIREAPAAAGDYEPQTTPVPDGGG